MNRIAAEAIPKVRQELFRLDGLSDFAVSCQEGCLKITFKDDAVLVDPSELLALLKGIHRKDTNDVLWQKIRTTAMNDLGAKGCRLDRILELVLVAVAVLFTVAVATTTH